ncbi:MAG: UDP-glucose/GDP-mannose dehydrogenase family protein [Candidatus Sericytochromatia bacterium]|nr:UDP-glucose/GDP-mannose dehydrogenase family protein [Candidatus Sericytochromatia bacterium]
MNVTVVGAGYVGLVTGACLAWLDHHVTLVESDAGKRESLAAGRCPIYEPGLAELLAETMAAGRLQVVASLEDSPHAPEVVFIAVGTPPLPSGDPDLSALEAVARGIGRHLDASAGVLVVNKSTVPIGSGNWVGMLVEEGVAAREVAVGARLTSSLPPTHGFLVASNPEFLREGSAIGDTLHPDRIVVGASDSRAYDIMRQLYRPILDQDFPVPPSLGGQGPGRPVPLVETDLASAELVKYAANAFLATKISFINEMAGLAEKVGADIVEVALGIGLDARIGPRFLQAGIGWGGSCFRKDVLALQSTAREYQVQTRLLEAAVAVNDQQRHVVLTKLQDGLKILKGRTIGLLGLSFKPDTDDLRDAPSHTIASQLLRAGARVRVHDPVAMTQARRQWPDLDMVYAEDPVELADGCDALVLVTEWAAYRRLDLGSLAVRMRGRLLVDGRNVIERTRAEAAGLQLVGIGRG